MVLECVGEVTGFTTLTVLKAKKKNNPKAINSKVESAQLAWKQDYQSFYCVGH